MTKRKNNKGFTLIELVVTIAVMAIISVFTVVTYTTQLEKQRISSDERELSNIATQAKVALSYDDIFAQIKNDTGKSYHLKGQDGEEDTLVITFPCTMPVDENKGSVSLENSYIANDPDMKLKAIYPKLYEALETTVGKNVNMKSMQHRFGVYILSIQFDGVRLSQQKDSYGNYIRPFSISNDALKITETFNLTEDP